MIMKWARGLCECREGEGEGLLVRDPEIVAGKGAGKPCMCRKGSGERGTVNVASGLEEPTRVTGEDETMQVIARGRGLGKAVM